MNSFSTLIEVLNKRVPMSKVSVGGEEFNRFAKIVTKLDGKLCYISWRGSDPDPNDFEELINDFISHFDITE